MKRMQRLVLTWIGLGALIGLGDIQAVTIDSPMPQGTVLTLYDTGMGLVNDQRRIVLARGENLVRFMGVPVQIDPASLSFSSMSGGAPLQVLDQRFEYDLTGMERMLQRYAGQTIVVRDGDQRQDGVLLSIPRNDQSAVSITLMSTNGNALVYPDIHRLNDVAFPQAGDAAYITPTVIARMSAQQDGPQMIRLNYLAEGLSWNVSYEAIQTTPGPDAYLSIRVGLKNESGGHFKDARVRLVSTEKGILQDTTAANIHQAGSSGDAVQRYAYGRENPSLEQTVASAAALQTYEIPGAITLQNGAQVFIQLAQIDKFPISRFYVYDGVKFDRFPRNRRNDWNYGTEYRKTIDTYLQFSNSAAASLGFNLPPGLFRLYQQTESGAVDLIGQSYVPGTPVGGSGYVSLGPAKDLHGERERTGYSEIVPLHEYEESFEIRLKNGSPEPVEVRVVEHLYRWSDFEIVKSDAEYVQTGPQTIEFRVELKPGGNRSVHYTVHYRW
jgi:hypothetical protein